MYLPQDASRARIREAQKARENRAEITRALKTGQISRRELMRMGIFTTAGALALVNGLSPYANSAYAAGTNIPTGVPRSPLFGAQPFTIPMPRLPEQPRHQLTPWLNPATGETEVQWPAGVESVNTRRLSYHTEFTASGGAVNVNPLTSIGPMEGRPPGEYFAHQRWDELLPQVGTVLTMGQIADDMRFHPNMPAQGPNAVWTFNTGRNARGVLPPPLIKVRYGEPFILRHYNALDPVDPHDNGGFGSKDQSTHNHNAHNSGASDGAANNQFFPGQFYDYHWSTILARHDMINTSASDPRASAPDDNGGTYNVQGDFREIQSTLWFHDHRFFLTAENVYKGHLGMLNYYSGPDRGNEDIGDGVNLRLPSGNAKSWGNSDFDINMIVIDTATDPDGQYFFDIFNTDGFLGDQVLVNFAYKPFFEVLPRKYRLRLLPAGMSRFWKWAIVNQSGQRIPFQIIANDGNLLPQPVNVDDMPIAGVAERLDIVVDFSNFSIGDRLYMVNHLPHSNGRKPDDPISIAEALGQQAQDDDPAVGAFLEFRIVNAVESVDVPGQMRYASEPDNSQVPAQLTEQIPVMEPVRERVFSWTRGGDDPRDENGECFPSCEGRESFPWTVKVNGGNAHSLNANRVSSIIPMPGEVEHWVLETSGGWDHPIHLHFEEGLTIDRGGDFVHPAEQFARKDVWRLPDGGRVRFQVRFGEFGGAYVNHCHNTVHEDNSMLMRYNILTDPNNPNTSQVHASVTPTPDPQPEGVTYRTPEILPEGNPFDPSFEPFPNG